MAVLLVLSAAALLVSASKGLFMSAAAANASGPALEDYLRCAEMACAQAPWNLSTSPQHIISVAIQSVGDGGGERGVLYVAALDRLLPALRCVPALYVGTTIPVGRDVYCGDVLNATFTAAAVETSAAAARAFVDRYGAMLPAGFAWYISPEQFLNHLAEGCSPKALPLGAPDPIPSTIQATIPAGQLAAAQGAFLREWTLALAAVRPGTRILWSPAAPESPRRGSNASAIYRATLAVRQLRHHFFWTVSHGFYQLHPTCCVTCSSWYPRLLDACNLMVCPIRGCMQASLRTIAEHAPLLTDIAIQDSVGTCTCACACASSSVLAGVPCPP